jgi:hypothetical protein
MKILYLGTLRTEYIKYSLLFYVVYTTQSVICELNRIIQIPRPQKKKNYCMKSLLKIYTVSVQVLEGLC